MRIRIAAAAALLPLASLAVAATPHEVPAEQCRVLDDAGTSAADDDLGVCTVPMYLQCDEATAGKVNVYAAVVGANAQFTADEPAGSFQAGDGCGEFENSYGTGVSQDNIHDMTFEGFVDANIDSLTFELHDLYLGAGRAGGAVELGLRILVDGTSPFGMEQIESETGSYTVPAMQYIEVTPEAGDATMVYRFSVTGLGAFEDMVVPGADFGAGEDHFVRFTITTPGDGLHTLVWGASEVPSGIVFNPAADQLAETVVDASKFAEPE